MAIDESKAFKPLNIFVLVISDTRDLETDTSGKSLVEMLTADGHHLAGRQVIKDTRALIADWMVELSEDPEVDVVITSGGTGVTGRDVTPEALEDVADKMIPGFGELFRLQSIESIGTSTIQSRATAGVVGDTYVFCLPGSGGAVRDGWTGILRYQLDIRHRPCNFAELLPRLKEGASNA
ncbi:MAG: molybdenum cofactor biosynthesis protein B [Alphaproteobacteria bacterium]